MFELFFDNNLNHMKELEEYKKTIENQREEEGDSPILLRALVADPQTLQVQRSGKRFNPGGIDSFGADALREHRFLDGPVDRADAIEVGHALRVVLGFGFRKNVFGQDNIRVQRALEDGLSRCFAHFRWSAVGPRPRGDKRCLMRTPRCCCTQRAVATGRARLR